MLIQTSPISLSFSIIIALMNEIEQVLICMCILFIRIFLICMSSRKSNCPNEELDLQVNPCRFELSGYHVSSFLLQYRCDDHVPRCPYTSTVRLFPLFTTG